MGRNPVGWDAKWWMNEIKLHTDQITRSKNIKLMWGMPQKSFYKICYYKWLDFKIFMWQKEYIQSLQGTVGIKCTKLEKKKK